MSGEAKLGNNSDNKLNEKSEGRVMSVVINETIQYSVVATLDFELSIEQIQGVWDLTAMSRCNRFKVGAGQTVIEVYDFYSEDSAKELKDYLEGL